MVKQARMLCRAGTPRRHGLWIGRRSPGGIERETAAVVAHGTAQLPSKWIRNEQECPKYVRYSMEHQEEQRTCPNLQSLQRFCLLPLGGAPTRSLLRLQYLNQVRMRSIIPVPTAKRGTTGLIRLSQCPLRTNASGLVARLYRSRRCDAVATSRLPTQI